MVARCPRTRALGVCVSTGVPAVRERVPHAEAGIGAIATQANTNVLYGTRTLRLLEMGLSPRDALETMLREDPQQETRQVIVIDARGRTAAFTGRRTIGWRGHLIGRDYVVAGNMLSGGEVIRAMVEAFEELGDRPLPERLMGSLEAGQEAGGDRRGEVSSALLVVGPPSVAIDLRVDRHPDPVKELRRLFDAHARR